MDVSPDCIALVCNGELEKNQNTKIKIEECTTCIGVDGGLNYCRDLQIKPHWIVGDFDSVESQVLQQLQENSDAVKLLRAKDETDLEIAVEKAKQLSPHAQIKIFGGLGGRLDHTLGNLYIALRNPGRVFLESEQQRLFAVDRGLGKVEIVEQHMQTLVLFPLYGKAQLLLEQSDGSFHLYTLDKCPLVFPFSQRCNLQVLQGEVIVCLDASDCFNTSSRSLPIDFSLKQPFIHTFEHLYRLSTHADQLPLSSSSETVYRIHPSSGKCSFPCHVGETVSLIPLYGLVSGIQTEGLKWELGPQTLSQLDKNFVGISNVCVGEMFSVQVTSGELLCIINHGLIDRELLQEEIEKTRLFHTTRLIVDREHPMPG